MRLMAKMEGVEAMRKRWRDLIEICPREASKSLQRFLVHITNDVKNAIRSGPKTGKIYGEHQASAPGEAPAKDKGGLTDHTRWVLSADRLSGYVIIDEPYATRLEFGDNEKKDGFAFIEPRPYLYPSLRYQTPIFQADIKAALKEACKR